MLNENEPTERTIKFLVSAELEVVESYDEENDKAETSNVSFSVGNTVEVDVLSETEDRISVQFADGSCCYGIDKEILQFVTS